MTQSSASSGQAPGMSSAACRTPSRAAEPSTGERLQPPSAEAVHIWFAAPSPTSRYLDIVLAGRTRVPGS